MAEASSGSLKSAVVSYFTDEFVLWVVFYCVMGFSTIAYFYTCTF